MLGVGAVGSLISICALKTFTLPAGPNGEAELVIGQDPALHHTPTPIRDALSTVTEPALL